MSRYFFAMPSDCEWPFAKTNMPSDYEWPPPVEPVTDYDRINPVCIMLSRCDLEIIDKHKSDGQDPRDFLQRLISENLRVLRDRSSDFKEVDNSGQMQETCKEVHHDCSSKQFED